MIPLYDSNPTFLRPYVTLILIALCLGSFGLQMWGGLSAAEAALFAFGFTPAALFEGAELPPYPVAVPPPLTVVTSMFVHGDLFHLLGNMLFLWIFGNNVEDAMGHFRFLVFYLLCGTAAALVQGYLDQGSIVPLIGASGAVSGIMGAYLLLYPRARVIAVVPLAFIFVPVRISAMWLLGIWIVFQTGFALMTDTSEPGIAWWSHVSGFVVGAILVLFMRRKGVRLWGSVDAVPIDPISRAAIQRGLGSRRS